MTQHDRAAARADLPHASALLPLLWRVIDRWHAREATIGSWEDALAQVRPENRDWAGFSELLQLINTFQWHEEDKSRVHDAGDEVLASVKRIIDASNARRVKTIEVLDAVIWKILQAGGLPVADAPLNSESPGSIIDRITILALKLYHIREELSTAGGTSAEEDLHARMESISEQMDDLALCLDQLLTDIVAGRRRIKLYRQVKVYKDPATGRYRSGLAGLDVGLSDRSA
ncbi:MAG TPA: DUF4254 domain-containing protein [Candidatus Krumholzibacteria bacterium]|nr:DUF4254 domain-containing protein [Candidatus Krumholzibacteria bacterium]HRX52535.1 DUF4254 domain-containing protein [Candidatus Krumholzibacteria bacterium]